MITADSITIEDQFEDIYLKSWNCEKGRCYLDPIRQTFVAMTPEETVRQRMIQFLQNEMGVPTQYLYVEEPLVHYKSNVRGRMDIVITYEDDDNYERALAVVECKANNISINAAQVIRQAKRYAKCVDSRYFILVNGINIQFYHKSISGQYRPIQGILTYREMLKGTHMYVKPAPQFQRLPFDTYFNLNLLYKEERFWKKIGEDTSEDRIPCIFNLDDCLLDESKKLPYIVSSRFALVEDLGVQFRQYNDRSDGGFGSADYRILLVTDKQTSQKFLSGFGIAKTAKTVNSPKYGNSTGRSMLVAILNNGDVDEMTVQIDMNKFLIPDPTTNRAMLIHNGAGSRRGFRGKELFAMVEQQSSKLTIQSEKVLIGELDYSRNITLDDPDVIKFFSNLIEYSFYRNEYKRIVTNRNRK